MKYQFNQKHLDYMKKCSRCVINVAEGAVRAGKTVDNVFMFASLLERSADRFHLATGATLGTAKLNIGDCNGLGLEYFFGSRAIWGRYRGNECMRIQTLSGEKIVIFAGAKNSDAFKRIRGNSYGMWIATEINLHHDSMIKEAFNRQLAARDRRVFWDLNPSSPGSPIYRDYIDLYGKKQQSGDVPENFFNYCHFTIFDNPALPPERIDEIVAQYDKDSVWYKRDILGQRCAAFGLVYPLFAKKRSSIVVPENFISAKDIKFINIGVDFGGNRSKTTFVATAFLTDGGICIAADHAIEGSKGEIDSIRVNLEFESFTAFLTERFPDVFIKYVFCDSEAQYLTNGLRKHLCAAGCKIRVEDSAKRRIKDRIVL